MENIFTKEANILCWFWLCSETGKYRKCTHDVLLHRILLISYLHSDGTWVRKRFWRCKKFFSELRKNVSKYWLYQNSGILQNTQKWTFLFLCWAQMEAADYAGLRCSWTLGAVSGAKMYTGYLIRILVMAFLWNGDNHETETFRCQLLLCSVAF